MSDSINPSVRGSVSPVEADALLSNNCDRILAEAGLLSPHAVRQRKVAAIVSTRNALSVLPVHLAEELGLPIQGAALVLSPCGHRKLCDLAGQVRITVLGREGTYLAVIDPDCTTVRLGYTILIDLDIRIDETDGKLAVRDPDGITAEIG